MLLWAILWVLRQYIYAYYAYIYSYYAYIYTGNSYAYYAYYYNSAAYTYSYYGYLYTYYAYAYFYNSTYAYYGYFYSYYGYVYAHNGYSYGYYAYAHTGNGYAYYAYLYGSYANNYCYNAHYYSYYCYTDASTTSKILSVTQINQETTNWCWAASSQMIMYYAGTYVQQCYEANSVFGRTDCCSNKTSTSCNNGATDNQMYNNFYHWGFANTVYNSYLSYSAVQSEINSNRPFNIHWAWKYRGGHAVVVQGYDSSQNLYINDPWYGQQTRSYSSTVNASDRYWYSTLYYIHK